MINILNILNVLSSAKTDLIGKKLTVKIVSAKTPKNRF